MYLGGKTRIASQVAAIVRANRGGRQVYVEPFLGGGSIAVELAPRFPEVYLSDASEDLILMWQAVQDGWVPPGFISEKEYQTLRRSEPSPLRAVAGFGCSFGGKWFAGYARGDSRSYAASARRSLLRAAPRISHASIARMDYREAAKFVGPDSVVYCDPPYAGTTGYKAVDAFDDALFWETMREWSATGAAVFVSGYEAPPDFTSVWRATAWVTVGSTNDRSAVEHLFMLNPRSRS